MLGEGPSTVLLLMGLGGQSADWGEQFPGSLAKKHRVVMLDNRGTGDSSRTRTPFSLEDLARDALRVLDAIGVERAHVLGLSMGGMIAQTMSLDHPERVDRLVLLSTFAGTTMVAPPSGSALALMMPMPGMRPDEIVRARVRGIAAKGFGDRSPEIIEMLVAQALDKPIPMTIYGMQIQALLSSDRSRELAKIRAKTLVVHGDEDPLVPFENGRRLATSIPGARLSVLAGCGHLPMWESPDELAREVCAFLD